MQNDLRDFSSIRPIGYGTSSCGYCRSRNNNNARDNENAEEKNTSVSTSSRASLYAKTSTLIPAHYKLLLDRGWRRSGSLLYKPDNAHSCCPHYTIRLPVRHFKPKGDQRSACNRWNRYVLGDEYSRKAAVLHPKSKQEKAKRRNTFDWEESIHAAEHAKLPALPNPDYKFEVTLEEDTYTDEKFDLFCNYQEHVHNDPENSNTPNSFENFLCNSPLRRSEHVSEDGSLQKVGSYHQMYRLNGRLIAMGVIDLIPDCVSGVYFVYHSDFDKYSFGKLSALREACLAKEGKYSNYYMGYYIHSCAKMQYKSDYAPQYVLDVESSEWNPLDSQMIKLMEKHKFVSMTKLQQRSKTENLPIEDLQDDNDGRTAEENFDLYRKHHKSLFDLHFPGMMSLEQMDHICLDIGAFTLQIKENRYMQMNPDQVKFNKDQIKDPRSIWGVLNELLACIGPNMSRQTIVQLD